MTEGRLWETFGTTLAMMLVHIMAIVEPDVPELFFSKECAQHSEEFNEFRFLQQCAEERCETLTVRAG